jgi:hypothetical protein
MAADKVRELEERVARLEEELRQVKAGIAKDKEPEKPWWEQIAGSQKGSKAFEEVVREMEKNRRAERKAAIQAAKDAERKEKERRKPRSTKQPR